MRRVQPLSLICLCALATSCADTLDVPVAPEFDEVLVAYASPTAEISSAVMAVVGDQLLELREQLEQSDVFDEILDVIANVQVELDENTDDNGNLVIPGLGAFPDPNAVLEINHNCPGWDPGDTGSNAETSGSVELTMVLNLGDIRPVVWGEAAHCQFSALLEERTLRSAYDGDIAVHLGRDPESGDQPVSTREPLRDLIATFILSGTLEVEGKELPIERSFRLGDRGELEILWRLGNGRTFVYLFNAGDFSQAIRDVNCTLGEECTCSLEERQCTLPSGSISW